jgi:hypothetical protein
MGKLNLGDKTCIRLHFSGSTKDAVHVDPGYVVRVEEEGAVSVVAAMAEAAEADSAPYQ